MITEIEKLQETCKHLIKEKARMQQEIDHLKDAMFDIIKRMDRQMEKR